MPGVRVASGRFSLRFGTSDTPAPEGVVAGYPPPRIVVAVAPVDPGTRVNVLILGAAGAVTPIALRSSRVLNGEQYFEGSLPQARSTPTQYYVQATFVAAGGVVSVDSRGAPDGLRAFSAAPSGGERALEVLRSTSGSSSGTTATGASAESMAAAGASAAGGSTGIAVSTTGQARTVSGTVTDKNGDPFAGAHVLAQVRLLRTAVPLGKADSNSLGSYRIVYAIPTEYRSQAVNLQMQVLDDRGAVVFQSDVLFNAPPNARIDIAMGGPLHSSASEISNIRALAKPLLGSLSEAELLENNDHRDLTFLAGQTGVANARLALWTTSARMAGTSGFSTEFLFAMLRGGAVADAETAALATTSSGVDLEGNAQRFIDCLCAVSANSREQALQLALTSNFVAAGLADSLKAELTSFADFASKAVLSVAHGVGKSSIGNALSAIGVADDRKVAFGKLFSTASGRTLRSFWKDLYNNPNFTKEEVRTLRFGVSVHRLTGAFLPLIGVLGGLRSAGTIKAARDLARYTAQDWQALLKKPVNGRPLGVPANITGSTPDQAVLSYATMLERNFTAAFPTAAFSGRLAKDRTSLFKVPQQVSAFLDANPSFDVTRTNIDAFVQKVKVTSDVRGSLLIAQRLMKLNPSYGAVSALLADGIHSARQIYAMGGDRFISRYAGNAAFGATLAARTFAKAEQTYAVSLATVTKFNVAYVGFEPKAVGRRDVAPSQAQLDAFPNLRTLFGAESFCACQDCETVLGAGAYLVDLLEFLRHRAAGGGGNVRDVLLARRPDIAQILINCPNTNTVLPYIDLVNELLEDAVAPPSDRAKAALVRQTTLTTPELNANPQWVNDAAYTKLAGTGAVYPWSLPFDLPLAEVRTYLGQLSLDRVRLRKTFQKPAGYPSTQARGLAVETLGLSALQADIIVAGALATGAGLKSWDYWGLPQSNPSIVDPYDPTKTVTGATWVDVLSQARVLLNRAGLSYQELSRLLNTRFINGDSSVSVVPGQPDECDVGSMTVQGLTPDVLDRIHRFVRLWRQLGWDVYDLDDAIWVLQAPLPSGLSQLNDQLLRQLSVVKLLTNRFGLEVRRAIALLAPTPASATIPMHSVAKLPADSVRPSLYQDLFVNLTVLNPPDPVFALNASETEIQTIGSAPRLADHAAALVAAFQVSTTDLNLAIATFTDGKLNVANLSALYRPIVLAGLAGVDVEDLISLLAIVEGPTDTTPFYETIQPFDGTRPEGLLAFLDAVAAISTSGLSIAQIDYVVRHQNTPASGVAPDPVVVGTLLLALRKGLAKIASDTAFQADVDGSKVRLELAKYLSTADVATAFAILSGTSTIGDPAAKSFVASALGSYMDPAAAQSSLVGGAALAPGEPRYDYVLTNLLAYERRSKGTGLIVQSISQAIGVAASIASLFLTEWFPSVAVPGKFLIEDFLLVAGLPLVDDTQPVPPTDPTWAPYFGFYDLLSRAALVAGGLGLSIDDARWWKDNGVGIGWLDPTKLPATPTAGAQGRFLQWSRLRIAKASRDRIPSPTSRSFAAAFGIAGGSTTKAAYLPVLASLMQWPIDALKTLCGDPANASDAGLLSLTYPADYRAETALARLLACFSVLRKMGIAANIASWIGDTVTAADADGVKQCVKAKYSGDQWLTLAKQLRDPLRQKQRDALVACLLATPPPAGATRWLDPNDVFAWFLIDVEMCACQSTSRIVQANAAIQLFVQRAFLNVESQVTVDLSADQDWLQWSWMSQYRVWEANREVFLFPENWIEPTLRSTKTNFFSQLAQQLQQGDVTTDRAEDALDQYLHNLEGVSRPDVVATFHDIEGDVDTLHVLARKQGDPPIYYQRRWIGSARWTGWEKVEVDINSDHLVPLVWNGKRYLFWLITTYKPDQTQTVPTAAQATGSSAPQAASFHLEVQLAWSLFRRGKWQAKQTSPQVLVFQGLDDASEITVKSFLSPTQLEIAIFTGGAASRNHTGSFMLGGAGTGVEAFLKDLSTIGNAGPQTSDIGPLGFQHPPLTAPTHDVFDGDWIAPSPSYEGWQSPSRPRVSSLWTTYDFYGALLSEVVLQTSDHYRLVVPHQLQRFDSSLPFIYRDPSRQYFCVPSGYYQNNYFVVKGGDYTYHPLFFVQYRFYPLYHAYVGMFAGQLEIGGVDRLYQRKIQTDPGTIAGITPLDFQAYYQPNQNVLPYPDGTWPTDAVDFESDAGYALYNWELFYHVPFLIGESLMRNQKFSDARKWFEYIFVPSGVLLDPPNPTPDPVPKRYWVTKPFAQMQDYASEQIDQLMQLINSRDPTLEQEVADWRQDPFDPDLIAQFRQVAYQRAIVMKYLDNLIRWGDQLFAQFTLESVNLATQFYVLAAELLGPRPEIVPPLTQPAAKTYADLQGSLDSFSNELVAAENAIPPVQVNIPVSTGTQKLPQLQTLYFRIPYNAKLLGYWDTVADRLFKIRHCMNIKGVVEPLPLFAPPIDPGLLVAAAAAGLDLGSVLNDINSAPPPYRFVRIIQLAKELCEETHGLGDQLLSALEKKDAEHLAQIHSGAAKQLQSAMSDTRQRQADEANQQLDVLAKNRQISVDRANFYTNRDLMNDWEKLALGLQGGVIAAQIVAGILEAAAALAHPAIPKIEAGAAGVGGTPLAAVGTSGTQVGGGLQAAAAVARMVAAALQTGAQMAAAVGQYQQRQDEWHLQGTLANDEIARIDSETLAAKIRLDIANREKASQDISKQEAADTDDYLHQKFTNEDLYDWMIGEVSTTYFQAYQLAYATARQAEQCYRRELAVADSAFIQFGYWDSLRQGLTAAQKLRYDLGRLESAYYSQNTRELEITKNISLLQLDPYALIELRNNGLCSIVLPELLFDLDNPGHYMRRIKTVALTIPCVVGPYSGVSATLQLLANQVRTSTSASSATDYPRHAGTTDARFTDDPGGTSEIVTSTAQNDSGLFELQFGDERYLPFETGGAISTWLLTLNSVRPLFDYSTITDVVIHLRYTARDGGAAFSALVDQSVHSQLNAFALAESRKGLFRYFSARREFGSSWAKFFNPGPGNDQVLSIDMPPERFPFYTNGLDVKVRGIDVLARTADSGDYTLVITPPGGSAQTVTISADSSLNGLHHWSNQALAPKPDLGRAPSPSTGTPPTWQFKLQKSGAADFQSVLPADLLDFDLVIAYEVS